MPTLAWACDTLGSSRPGLDPETLLGPISIDTRSLHKGDTFWALSGARDGHDFVEAAFDKGAKLAVVNEDWWRDRAMRHTNRPAICVKDTRTALTRLGMAWRLRWTNSVVGITGTNGKTSTKDLMLILLALKFRTAGTTGNLNNELGVPLTMLSIGSDTEIAVVEMGASHPGEIGTLCKICLPTHGLVTSIGKAHLEGFGSTQAIAQTKGELYEAVADNGVAFVPTDDELCRIEAQDNRTKIGFGFQARPLSWSAEFHQATDLRYDDQGCAAFSFEGTEIRLSIPGKPAAMTALAALTTADHFGIPPQSCREPMRSWKGVHARVDVLRVGGVTIIDDSYNANPSSMLTALETLSLLPGRRHIAILGDMNELGEFADAEHRQLGSAMSQYPLVRVVFVGSLSKLAADSATASGVSCSHFATFEELAPEILGLVKSGDVILVKGSRGGRLERVVQLLTDTLA